MMRLVVDRPDLVGPWVAERIGGFYHPIGGYAMGVEDDGVLIAGVMYDSYFKDGSIMMHVAAEPGRRWLTRERLRIFFHYPFEYLGVRKVIGLVQSTNKEAIRFDEHIGFNLEARLTGACVGGDLLLYTMTRNQCRFLGADNEIKTQVRG